MLLLKKISKNLHCGSSCKTNQKNSPQKTLNKTKNQTKQTPNLKMTEKLVRLKHC